MSENRGQLSKLTLFYYSVNFHGIFSNVVMEDTVIASSERENP